MNGLAHIDNPFSIGLHISADHKGIFFNIIEKIDRGQIKVRSVEEEGFSALQYQRGAWVEAGEVENYKTIWEASDKFALSFISECAIKVIRTLPTKSHKEGRVYFPKVLWHIEKEVFVNRKKIEDIKISPADIKLIKEFIDVGKMSGFISEWAKTDWRLKQW